MFEQKWILIGVLSSLIAACQVGQEQGSNFELTGESTLSEQQKKEVVAKIGDVEITLAEFEKRLNQQSTFARNQYRSAQQKQTFLETMVRFELLANEALRRGYDQDPQVKLAQKQAMVSRFTAEEVSKLVEMKDITDQDIQGYYDRNTTEFSRPAQARAAHILLKDQVTAQTVLKTIRAEIQKDPARARKVFARFVTEHSTESAAQSKHGDLGFFGEPGGAAVKRPQGKPPVPTAVARAVFQVESVGQLVPDVIETPAGWHIVQKTGFRRALQRTLPEVRAKIRMKLFRSKKRQAMEDFVKMLRDKATVVIDEKVLESAKAKKRTDPIPNLNPPGLPQGGIR